MGPRFIAALFLVAAVPGFALSPEETEFFEKKVRPVLAERCYECHSASARKVKGNLLLDSRDGVLKGGDSGPALVAGHPEKSLIIKAVRYNDEDLQMPPKHRLDPQEIANLEQWVKMGVPDPREATANAAALLARRTEINFDEARKFWSFQPIKDSNGDVDSFLAAKWKEKSLKPARPADRRTLIRRATLDLTGLPPTPEEVESFLADRSAKAFEKVVERLLGSVHYGERWGRHWLDVVRYADTSGCNSDYPVPSAYKYRNYVIDSFNQDKPYDQFLREQIAGDLMPAKTDQDRFENITATGYLAISRRFGSRAAEFHQTLEDTIDNMGKGMLGLSLSCARCHDHKYDPVPARDYYALYGIFNSTKYAFPGTEIYKHPKDFVPLATGTSVTAFYKHYEELAELDDLIEKLQEEKKALERTEKAIAKVEDDAGALQVERKDLVKLPERRTLVEVKAALEDARTRQRLLEFRAPTVERAYAVSEAKPANAKIQIKGDPRNLGEEVPRGFLQILGGQKLPDDLEQSGRMQLAEWITDPRNPLTARVMVNRIWLHHFGKGIVQTPNDFGARGKAPTHPELLDFLAARFIESGWSLQAMHKLIMLSRGYQMSSEDDSANAAIDASNDYFWKFNRRRLSAEEVRDSMLAISGHLDRTMGGPHPFPPENEWRYTQHRPFVAQYDTDRRSVYLMQQRIKRHPFLEMFDGADPNATTGERPLSITPIQALFMMNDPFAHEQADGFAVRIGLAQREDAKRIRYAYELAFGRPATKEEVRTGESFLRECRAAMKETELPADRQPRAALASFARVLFSSNEFMYVD
jgi:hypothetical protein